MSLLGKIRRLFMDPPPEFLFELSPAGIAWARSAAPGRVEWAPLEPGVIEVSPLKDNVANPEALAAAVRAIAPAGAARKQRRAALILPDFCARVAVLDFDNFPSDPAEQVSLVRFRLKRTMPFDIDSAVISCAAQPRPAGARQTDVAAAVIDRTVVERYEAPFIAAGYQPGLVTLSALAALPLVAAAGAAPLVAAKLTGGVLAVSVIEQDRLRMFRCVELAQVDEQNIFEVLHPTLAYVEDELAAPARTLHLCGFSGLNGRGLESWGEELGVTLSLPASRYQPPGPFNAGLIGYLHTLEGA
jgi:type IV pilus assembly protein PilM